MSASGITGTLSVGVPGGPQTNIFTLNNPPLAGSVAVSTAASSQGNILFNSSSDVFGAIGVTQPGGPFLRNITAGNPGTVVNFQGPVFATILDVSGTGAVNFNSRSINISATNFSGDGFIGLAPNTTLIGALTTTAGANTGTLSLGNGSILDGAVGGAVGLRSINVVGGTDQAGASATITGATSAFAFSLGRNTLNIDGALTIANTGPGGVVNTTLASPTVYGNIRPVGATNLGPTLQVNVTVPSTSFIPLGTQFAIIQTHAGTVQSGTNGSVVAVTVQNPTNPLYTFAAVPAAGTVAGEVVITTTGIPILVPVLLAIAPTVASPVASTDLATNVLPALNAFSEPGPVVNALAQLTLPAPILAAPLVTFQGSRLFQGLLLSRAEDILCGPLRTEEDEVTGCREAQRSGWWLKGFGYSGRQGARDGMAGYDTSIVGAMIAYDAPIGPDTRVGFGLGYARSNIDGQTFGDGSAKVSFDSYRATAYLSHETGPWFLHGDASVGLNSYTGARNIDFTGVQRRATSDYNGQDYTGSITGGYRILANAFTITPRASLQYSHVDVDGYSERGAGDIGLRVGSQSYDYVESVLGVKVARPFEYRGARLVPEVHANWLHELNNPTLVANSSFTAAGSPTFRSPGLSTADNTYNVGAGLTLLSCTCAARTWSLEAVYDYQWRDDRYTAHQGMMRFAARF